VLSRMSRPYEKPVPARTADATMTTS
jgi:hypothetical protein